MRTFWHRLASTTVATGSGLVVWQVAVLAHHRDVSLLMILAACGAAAIGLGAVVLALSPSTLWERGAERVAGFIRQLRSAELQDNASSGHWLLAAGATAFLLIGGWQLSQPDDPRDDDQAAFLQTAAEVQAGGGPLRLIRDLYAGRFEEANRHPLYIGLLSIHPTERFGRGLSFAIGLTTLIVLTWLVQRSRGPTVAGLFCLLLGTNGAFLLFSTRVVCDVLMVLWGGAAFLLAARRSAWRQFLVGILLGLAYLTKGTGLLLLAGYAMWFILDIPLMLRAQAALPQRRRDRWRVPLVASAAFVFGWLLCTSPLLVRNVRRYDSPIYNVNSWLMFADAYENPVALAERMLTGEAARAYLESHSAGDILFRATSGLVWESFIVLRILGPVFLDDARVLFGLPLAVCAVISIMADPRREHSLLAVWLVICVAFLAWYIPVAAGDRFPLPLLAPLLMTAAEGIVRLIRTRSASTSYGFPMRAFRHARCC